MEILQLEGSKEFEEYIPKLLNKAKSSAQMSTSFHPEFYNREKVRGAIERIIKNKINFRVVLDSRANMEQLSKECAWFFKLMKEYENFKVLKCKGDGKLQHLIIVDNSHIRIEKPHEVETGERGSRNLIIFDAPSDVVNPVKMAFEKDWDECEDLSDIFQSKE